MRALSTISLPPPLAAGRLFGIPIMLDWSWMPMMPLYAWAIAAVLLPGTAPGRSQLVYWGLGVLTAFLLVVSVVVHELAHALMARAEGLEITDITLHIFGGMARMASEPESPSAEFKIAIVGPAASFLLGVLFLALDSFLFYGTTYVAEGRVLGHLGIVNMILATFNLLPGFPLDGGRVLKAALWRRRGDAESAMRTARSAGRSIAFALVPVGLYVFLFSDRLTGLWSLSIGAILLLVLGLGERASGTAAKTVAAFMRRPPVAVEPHTTVHDLINDVLPRHRQAAFLVTSGGRLHGVLSLEAIRDLPRDAWSRTPVSARMKPVDDTLFVPSTASPAEAARLLSENGLGQAAVLDAYGYVVGSVGPEELGNRRA